MSRISRISLVAALIALFTVSAFAGAQKRRSVQHPGTPTTVANVKGTVVDDVTGQPVNAVQVSFGTAQAMTDAAGRFQIVFMSAAADVQFRFSRSGYVTKDVTLTAGSDTTIRLAPTATVRVKMTNGAEYAIDSETAQFSFLSTMSGYPVSDNPRFCRNGEDWQPARATLAKIQGPATAATDAACCSRPVLQVKVTLKSGEQSDAKFTDNCVGYEPIFIGRDHVSADFRYLRFTEITEIVFP